MNSRQRLFGLNSSRIQSCVLVILLISACGGQSLAQPHLVFGAKPETAEVRAVAAMFLTKIADADAEGAKALFVGSADEAALRDIELHLVRASNALNQVLTVKFGDSPEIKSASVAAMFRELARQVSAGIVMLNGESADVVVGGLLNSGLDLHRIDGQWKVVRLMTYPATKKSLGTFLIAWSESMERVIAQVNDGELATADVALRTVDGALRAAFAKLIGDGSPTTPDDVAILHGSAKPATFASTAATQPFITATELVGLIGKHVSSPEVSRTIASLPGTPLVRLSGDAMFVNSEPVGISMRFDVSQLKLVTLFLYSQGIDGYDHYKGPLPHGISVIDTRVEIERKLGRPALSSGGKYYYRARYPSLGIDVDYMKPHARDPENPVRIITLSQPSPSSQPSDHTATMPLGPRLIFRMVVTDKNANDPSVEVMTDPHAPPSAPPLLVSRKVLLDETDVAEVSVSGAKVDVPPTTLVLQMTPEGAKKLEQISAANQNHFLVIALDGSVVTAPRIHGVLSEAVAIDFNDYTEVMQFYGRLHAVINALPTTLPSTLDAEGAVHKSDGAAGKP